MTGDREYHIALAIYDAQRDAAGLPPISAEKWDDLYDSGMATEIRHVAKYLIEQFVFGEPTPAEAWSILKPWIENYDDEEEHFSRYSGGVLLDGVMTSRERRAISDALKFSAQPILAEGER